jgi:hypothetical protein
MRIDDPGAVYVRFLINKALRVYECYKDVHSQTTGTKYHASGDPNISILTVIAASPSLPQTLLRLGTSRALHRKGNPSCPPGA